MGSAAFFDAGGALREVVKTSGGNAAADLVNYTNSRPGGWSNVAIGDASYPNLLAMDFIAPTASGLSLRIKQRNYVAQKFGLFLHFNMSTFIDVEVAAGTESANTFNPSALNIDQWVSTAQAAKVQYATLVTKHHDGFCLWPTAETSHSIASSSWYAANGNIDIVSQFCSKMRAGGITPCLYFSIWDKQIDGTVTTALSQAAYKTYIEAQITELLSNYGAIGALWIDGTEWHWTPTNGIATYPWDSTSQRFTFISGLQSGNCLLVNNSHTGTGSVSQLADSNICEYESTLSSAIPATNTSPAEWCNILRSDGNWFWKSSGNPLRSASDVLADISLANGRNASYLLNAGPDNTGVIPSNMVTTLTTIGGSL